MASVAMPDGTVVEMPDQVDPQLGARLRAFQAAQANKTAISKPLTFGSTLAGEGEMLGRGVANIPSAALGAAGDLYNRLNGGASGAGSPNPLAGAAEALHVNPGAAEQNLTGTVAALPAGQAVGRGLRAADTAIGNFSPTLQDVIHQAGSVASDVANLAPVFGAANLAGRGAGALASGAEGAAENAFSKAGFKTAEESPIASGAAGSSGKQALTLQNQAVHNTIGASEANVPHGVPLNYEQLEGGRAAPNTVQAATAKALPTGALSPAAVQMVNASDGEGANIIKGSPDVQNTINILKTQFADPEQKFTGNDIINNMRQQRQEGYTRLASGDADQGAIGKVQLNIAKALEQHVQDTLPADAPVSLEQFQASRTALAKNYAVQSALKGTNIDPQALARMQQANPDLLTGGLKTMADFASQHPAVSGLANSIEVPPSFKNDVGKALNGGTGIGGALARIFGVQAGARKALTGMGGTEAAVGKAKSAFPNQALGDQFAPRDTTPQPPPGMTASPPTAPPPAPQPPPGSIPMGDFLAHGVEQPGPQGLSLAPEPGPPPTGPKLGPQDLAAGFNTQGLELEHPAVTQSKALEETNHAVMTGAPQNPAAPSGPNAQLGDIMSQGVPEGIAQRSAQPHQPGLGDTILSNAGEGFTQMPSAMPPAKHFGGVLYRGAPENPDQLNEIGGRFLTEHVVPEEGGTAASDYGPALKAYPVQSTKMADVGTPQQAIKTFNLPNHASMIDIGKAARDAGYDLVKFNVDGKNEYLHFPGPEFNGK